ARGYRIVHVVPGEQPATTITTKPPVAEPPAPHPGKASALVPAALSASAAGVWPRTLPLAPRPQTSAPAAPAETAHGTAAAPLVAAGAGARLSLPDLPLTAAGPPSSR